MKIKLSQEISDAKEVKQNLNTITKLDEKKRTKKSFLKKIFNKVLRFRWLDTFRNINR